jgi:hypothetical protein
MTILAFPIPYSPFRGFTNDGEPLSGGLLYCYAAGTNTPLVTYQDPGQVSPNANPVVLNARGEAPVFLPPNVAYKFLLTDSLGNTIPGWPIDNLSINQLITLYGGVDTGSVNTYVLNFVANFTSLTDGIVIYWIPANTNNGPSTININNLGVINIVNPDGSALSANEITANQPAQILIKGGQALLITPAAISSNLFTQALTGFTGTVNAQINWKRTGNKVRLININSSLGTSNAATMSLTVPATLLPSRTQIITTIVQDAGTYQLGTATIASSGVITFALGATLSGAGFTSSGQKGLALGWTMDYDL